MDSALVIVLLAAALTAAVPPAFPQPPQTRAEALGALASPDAATRAEAVVWLANRGGMEDAPLLHERLRDESSFVRGFAEQGLWLLWGRSGDAEVDRLMALGTEAMQAGRKSAKRSGPSRIIEENPGLPRAGTGAPRCIRAIMTNRLPTATRC
jgi:hypothetical protein